MFSVDKSTPVNDVPGPALDYTRLVVWEQNGGLAIRR